MSRVNPDYYEVGNIIFNKRHRTFYLVLAKGRYEDDIYYRTLDLQQNVEELLGYWDYMLPVDWELWG